MPPWRLSSSSIAMPRPRVQATVPVHPDDTEESLSARILVEEHRLYPEAVRLFAEGRLAVVGRRVVIR